MQDPKTSYSTHSGFTDSPFRSPEELRVFVEAMPDMLFRYRISPPCFEYVSSASLQLVGYTPESFNADPELLCKAVHPDDRQLFQTFLQSPEQFEELPPLRWIRQDGQVIRTELRHTLINDEGGRVIGVQGIVRDVTQRKQVEDSLRRYETLAESSRDIILSVQRDNGHILDANAAAITAYGYTRQELLSLSISDLRALETHGLTAGQMAKADSEGILFETVHRRKDGSTFPVEVSSRGATVGGTRILISMVRNITERKQAEDARRETERRLSVIVDSIADGFYALDRDWRFTHVNDAALRYFSQTREGMLGRSIFEVFAGFGGSVLESEYRHAMETGEPTRILAPSVVADRTVEIFAYPGPENMTVLFRDVTKQICMEQALRQSEHKFSLMFEKAAYAAALSRVPDGVLIDVNEAWVRTFGYTKQEAVGKTTFDLNINTDAAGRARIVAALEEHGIVRDQELTFRIKSGEMRTMSVNIDLLEVGGQKTMLNMAQDITARKRAEEALRRQAALIDLSPDAIIVRRLDGTILFWSQGAETLYGWTRAEAIEQQTHSLFHTEHPEPLDQITEQLKRTGHWSGELVHFARDGRRVVVQSRWLAQLDAQGEVTEILESNVDITQRKHDEEELRRQREWFRVTLTSIGDGVIAGDSAGRVTFLNPVATNLTGWTLEEAIGQPVQHVFQIIDESTRTPGKDILADVLKEKRVFALSNHTALVARDGRETPIEDSAAPILDATGNVIGGVLVFHDVTEKRRSQAALQASEERYRQLFSGMTEGFALHEIITDESGKPCDYRFLDLNTSFERLTGLKRQAVVGRRMNEVLPNDDPRWIEMYGQVALTGESIHLENYSPALQRWYEVFAYRPAPRQFAVIFMDITARKQAEEALRQRAEELETVMDVVPVAIWIGHDPECKIITGNHAANEFYEAEVGENVSASTTPARRFFQNGRELTAEELPMQYSARLNVDVRGSEFEVVMPSGTRRTLWGYAAPLRNPDGSVRGDVGAFVDITERKQAEREREGLLRREQAAREQAEAAIRIRDQFISVASHELRTPLTAALGYAELLNQRLRERSGLDDDERRMLRTIEKQTARLNKMIANLLDISRIERSQLAIEQAPFDLDATIERIVDEIRPTLRQHTIEYRNAAGSVWINGDELRLEQVLQNLVQNAVKYSPLGGPVRIEMSEQNGVMHILVRDNGIGIPSDALPQLFTRFYRAPNAEANHISGLGVGLYVAREIVRLHGGAITVSSEEGKGAEFTVSLPRLSERARLV